MYTFAKTKPSFLHDCCFVIQINPLLLNEQRYLSIASSKATYASDQRASLILWQMHRFLRTISASDSQTFESRVLLFGPCRIRNHHCDRMSLQNLHCYSIFFLCQKVIPILHLALPTNFFRFIHSLRLEMKILYFIRR